jgi:hypothetical protein
VIDGKEYLEYRGSGRKQYLTDCGFNGVSQEDEQFILYYTEEERVKKIEREVKYKREIILAKVKKICGDEVTEVAEVAGDGIFVRGSNGKVAHLLAVYAGGYNIQCLHIRVMVKESRWLE